MVRFVSKFNIPPTLLLVLLHELVANRVMFFLLAVELNQVNEANRHVNPPAISTSRNNNVGTVDIILCPDRGGGSVEESTLQIYCR